MAEASPLRLAVSELWWMGVLKSTAAIFFGTITVFWPGITLVVLIYLLSAFVIAVGLVETIHGLMSLKRRNTWWMTLLIGLITLGVGVYLARHPDASLRTFILIVGISFIGWGILDLVRSFLDRFASSASRTMSFLGGLLGLVAGVVVLLQPVSGGLAFVWVLGLYGIIYGIVALAASMELRNEFDALTARIGR